VNGKRLNWVGKVIDTEDQDTKQNEQGSLPIPAADGTQIKAE